VLESLRFIREYRTSEFPTENKIKVFARMQRTIGKTTLCLKGGGGLLMHHFGVIKGLVETDILPSVILGSSGGALAAAWVGCHSPSDLTSKLHPYILLQHGKPVIDPVSVLISRIARNEVLMDEDQLDQLLRTFCGDLTFEEAYKLSGRIIAISIPHKRQGSSPPILCYVTSPQVLVRSASLASCYFPGVLKPTTILAKDQNGDIVPYQPASQWKDGPLNNAVPISRLSELFNVTQYIAVQLNPQESIFLERRSEKAFGIAAIFNTLDTLVKLRLQYRMHELATLIDKGSSGEQYGYRPVGSSSNAEIPIVPRMSPLSFLGIVREPTVEEAREHLSAGRQAVYPNVAFIRYRTALEQELDDCLKELRKQDIRDSTPPPIVPQDYRRRASTAVTQLRVGDENGFLADSKRANSLIPISPSGRVLSPVSPSRQGRSHLAAPLS